MLLCGTGGPTQRVSSSTRVRRILYDLTELENASRFKKGESQARTPKKVANVKKWFGKLEVDLTNFLAYFGK